MTDGEYGCVIRCYPPVKDGPLERLVGKLRCAAFGTDASLKATIVLLAICKPDNRADCIC